MAESKIQIENNLKDGVLLVSDPFLPDTNFERSVVLLCTHKILEGSFGFIVNKKLEVTLADLVQDKNFGQSIPVYLGGPVEQNTLHFIHSAGDKIDGSFEISPGIFWGGNFEQMLTKVSDNEINANEVKFFVGYSGWSESQLQNEIKEKSWIVCTSTKELVFETEEKEIWRTILKQLGGKYKQMSNYPIDPRLN
ncbi:MAG: YqgE/AlgH family protein [Cytophagales bacterium]